MKTKRRKTGTGQLKAPVKLPADYAAVLADGISIQPRFVAEPVFARNAGAAEKAEARAGRKKT